MWKHSNSSMARSLVGPTQFLSHHPYKNPLIKSLHLPLPSLSTVHVTSSAAPMSTSDHHHHHPSFEILGGARDRFLPSLTLPHLSRPYNPFPLFAWNRHVETIFASFFRSLPDVRLRRECLRTQDGGAVALDWVSGDDRRLPPDSPLLILLVRYLIVITK